MTNSKPNNLHQNLMVGLKYFLSLGSVLAKGLPDGSWKRCPVNIDSRSAHRIPKIQEVSAFRCMCPNHINCLYVSHVEGTTLANPRWLRSIPPLVIKIPQIIHLVRPLSTFHDVRMVNVTPQVRGHGNAQHAQSPYPCMCCPTRFLCIGQFGILFPKLLGSNNENFLEGKLNARNLWKGWRTGLKVLI